MNKQEFLCELKARLSGLPRDDIDERLSFYTEMIDDRMEEGLSEEAAVSGIGSVDEIASQIAAELPLAKIIKNSAKPRRALKPWETVLLVLGSPLWVTLLLAVLAVILAAYAVAWAFIAFLWAVEVALAACSLEGIISFFWDRGNALSAIAMLGAGVFCAGLSIFVFLGCRQATLCILRLTKKAALAIKNIFIGKECVK